jgi:predicted nucleic acid-binding protein
MLSRRIASAWMIDCSLDSTTLIHLTRGWVPKGPVSAKFKNAGISHVALGEIIFGAFKGSTRRELDKLSGALQGLTILHGDQVTAIIYARIKNDLARQGNLIPETTCGLRPPPFRLRFRSSRGMHTSKESTASD